MNHNKDMPLISVIIPVYNGEKYIGSCVEGLAAQSHKKLEIILVNDGSQDNSQQIMERLAAEDSRVVPVTQKNTGVSTARNSGMDRAKGEFICFADVDDMVSVDYVSYLYDLLRETDADISVVPNPLKFAGDGSGIFDKASANDIGIQYISGIDAARDLLYYKIKMSCWSKLFRRSFLDRHKIRFHGDLICGEGFNFCLESFIKAQKVAIGHQAIYGYRLDNSDSAMTKFNIGLIRNGLGAIDRMGHLIENHHELYDAYNYAKWHTNCDFFNMLVGCGASSQYRKEYLIIKERCRKLACYARNAPVSGKDKMKGIMYGLNPYFTARAVNGFRSRKFETIKRTHVPGGGYKPRRIFIGKVVAV